MTQIFHGGQYSDISRLQLHVGRRPVVAGDVAGGGVLWLGTCFVFALPLPSALPPPPSPPITLAQQPATESAWRPRAQIC